MFNKTSQRWNQLGGETALATLAEGGYTNWFIKRRGRLPKEVPGAGKGPRGTRKVKKGGSTGKLPEHMTEGKNTVNKPLEILTKKKPRKTRRVKKKKTVLGGVFNVAGAGGVPVGGVAAPKGGYVSS